MTMFPIDIDFSRLKEVLTYDPQAPMIFSSGIFLWLFAAFMQLDLSCRPCSVYGQKPCWRGDYACLRDIKPEQVIAKIEGIVG